MLNGQTLVCLSVVLPFYACLLIDQPIMRQLFCVSFRLTGSDMFVFEFLSERNVRKISRGLCFFVAMPISLHGNLLSSYQSAGDSHER